MVQIKGLLDTPPSKGFVLMKNVNQSSGWPKVVQYIDLKEIKGFLNTKVFNMIVWLDPKDPNSFAGHPPALNLNSAMNSGYAFQWYAMSIALTGIYLFTNIKRKQNNERNR
jgi:surfeit locus 1 family protein